MEKNYIRIMKKLSIKKMVLLLFVFVLSCSKPIDVRMDLKKELDSELDTLLAHITDSTVMNKNPHYEIKRFKPVGGTLISYYAIVDFFYVDTTIFPVFYRRVYRYIESEHKWELHRDFLLKTYRLKDDVDKYIHRVD